MSDTPSGNDTRTLPLPPGLRRAPLGGGFYVVVFREGSSSLYPLPSPGVVTAGRAPECDLSVQDASLSRRHARFVITEKDVQVSDLDSRNGTLVNGVRISGARALLPGDVVTLGQITLLLGRGITAPVGRKLLGSDELTPRIQAEVERSLHFERPLAVLHLWFDGAVPPDAGQRVLARLRRLDEAGFSEPGHLVLLLLEADEDDAQGTAEEILEALGGEPSDTMATTESGTRSKVGIALCPTDGCDAQTLLASARAAAEAARPGGTLLASATAVRLDVREEQILVADPAMHRLYGLIRRLAVSDLPVLITGETGTGKELAAQALHAWSPRADKPFVALNCAALQDTLIESELFGHERGAFTGATQSKIGLLESARGGTVFLDEVGELSLPAQAKLLRAIETGRITRVGDVRERPIDIRLVAATHRDLAVQVAEGRFREDLSYRLCAATVALPPLRDRPREIPLLAQSFLDGACDKAERERKALSVGALQALVTREWKGNVRELRNLMRLLAVTVEDVVIHPWHLEVDATTALTATPLKASEASAEYAPDAAAPSLTAASPKPFQPLSDELRELERRRMIEALAAAGGQQKRAAQLLQMPLRTFTLKFKKYGLRGEGGQ